MPFIYSVVYTVVIFPLVVGWTLGLGFLYRLGLIDFSGAVAIHLSAGFSCLFGAIIIKQRLGRFEPIVVKKAGDKQEVYLSSQARKIT